MLIFFHLGGIGVERNAVLPCQGSGGRRPRPEEILEGRTRPPHEARLVHAVVLDHPQSLLGLGLFGPEAEHPVAAIDDLPVVAHEFDLGGGGIEGNAVFLQRLGRSGNGSGSAEAPGVDVDHTGHVVVLPKLVHELQRVGNGPEGMGRGTGDVPGIIPEVVDRYHYCLLSSRGNGVQGHAVSPPVAVLVHGLHQGLARNGRRRSGADVGHRHLEGENDVVRLAFSPFL